jgi:drug/metabolite transporter (DMT)-like permease
MRPLILAGILFIVLGGFTLAYQGFNYTHRDNVLDVGPIHATVDKHEHVYVSPLLGALALIGGIVMLAAGVRQKS